MASLLRELCLKNTASLGAVSFPFTCSVQALCESVAFLRAFYFVCPFVFCWEPFSWMGSVSFLLKLLAGKDLLGHLEVIPGIFPPAYSHVPCPVTLSIPRSGCLGVCRTLKRTAQLQTDFSS